MFSQTCDDHSVKSQLPSPVILVTVAFGDGSVPPYLTKLSKANLESDPKYRSKGGRNLWSLCKPTYHRCFPGKRVDGYKRRGVLVGKSLWKSQTSTSSKTVSSTSFRVQWVAYSPLNAIVLRFTRKPHANSCAMANASVENPRSQFSSALHATLLKEESTWAT